ncbi:hypothetical protein [Paenibacillus sp. FSL K6-2859]|uniref:hypothetical protein n=1 Tax=Paenibacillus sp. FSL K6-2859 TaxID=2921482 RepID=UPI0030F4D769
MKNLLCGSCAIKAALELKDRIELANSRKLGVEYHCLGCGKVHSWTFPQVEEEAAAIEETDVIEEKQEKFVQETLF